VGEDVNTSMHIAADACKPTCPIPSEMVVEATEVYGKCEVVCGEDIEGDRDEWFSAAPNRFYFFEVNISHCCAIHVFTHR